MSVAKRNSPPGRSMRAIARDALVLHEAPLPVPPLRPRIGIEQVDAGERRWPAARRAVRSRRRDAAGYCRACAPSIAASAFAMPLTNGSHADEAGARMALGLARSDARRRRSRFRAARRRPASETASRRSAAAVRRDRARAAAAASRTARPGAAAAHGPCAGRRRRARPSSRLRASCVMRGIRDAGACKSRRSAARARPSIGCRERLRRYSNALLSCVGEVGLLPGEAAVLVRRAAEMAVGRGAAVDRPVELERAADVGRASAGRSPAAPSASLRSSTLPVPWVSTRSDIGSATPIA